MKPSGLVIALAIILLGTLTFYFITDPSLTGSFFSETGPDWTGQDVFVTTQNTILQVNLDEYFAGPLPMSYSVKAPAGIYPYIENGVLYVAPGKEGTYKLTVTAEDALAKLEKEITVTVLPKQEQKEEEKEQTPEKETKQEEPKEEKQAPEEEKKLETPKPESKPLKDNIIRTDNHKPVGKKITDEQDYETTFTSVQLENGQFTITLYHDSPYPLPIWAEGMDIATPSDLIPAYEEITITIPAPDGEVPTFILHVGAGSEQFQFGIQILNIQSYPTLGDNWTVEFTTSGTSALQISGHNGTEFGTDLQFLEIKCGNTNLSYNEGNNKITVPGYNCNTTGTTTSKVLTASKHALEFKFGPDVEYAFNAVTISACGNVSATGEYVLNQSISSTGTCLNVTASNVDIDCAGFNITFGTGGTSSTFGVFINPTGLSSFSNVTVRNCGIRKTSTSGGNNDGITTGISNQLFLYNNTISTTGTGNIRGIALDIMATRSFVENNTITATSTGGADTGLFMTTTTAGAMAVANIVNNTITSDGASTTAQNRGIDIDRSENTTIFLNNVTTDSGASGTNNHGIRLGRSKNITVANNTILSQDTGSSASHGLFINQVTNHTIIQNNTITTIGPTSHAIRYESGLNATFAHNTLNATASTSNDWSVFNVTNTTATNTTLRRSGVIIQYLEDINGTSIKALLNTEANANQPNEGRRNLSKYVEASTNAAAGALLLNISYTDAELTAAGIANESSLQVWKYNTTASAWTNESFYNLNGVDTTNNRVFVNITNFASTFGVFEANAVPQHDTPILNSTFGTNLTTENLTVYPQNVTDGDDEAVKNITDFQLFNGSGYVSIARLNTPFEGGSNSTFTRDYSTFVNNGTVSGAAFSSTSGHDGFGAYTFDGVNDVITIADRDELDFENDTKFSISARINSPLNWTGVLYRIVVAKGTLLSFSPEPSGTDGYFLYVGFNGQVGFALRDTDGDNPASSAVTGTGVVSANQTHHLVATFNGTDASIYVDGALEDTTLVGSVNNSNSVAVSIGSLNGTSRQYTGIIDEVQIFNRSLSQEQITALYNNRTDLIVSNETEVGDIWQACVTPNDRTTDGTTKCSNNLTILGGITACQNISSSGEYVLQNNISATGTCINITASNVNFNCDGYTITYDTGGTGGDGIVIAGQSGATIRNCIIVDGNNGGEAGYAINSTNSASLTARNNSIYTNGTNHNYGIALEDSNQSAIYNNTINTSGSGFSSYGIRLRDSVSAAIENNTIYTNGTSSNYGIFFDSSNIVNTKGTVHNNTILTRGSSTNNYGIYLFVAHNNTVNLNNVTTSPTSSGNRALYLFSAFDNNATNNYLQSQGASDNHALVLSGSDRNRLQNNTVRSSGTSSQSHGVYLTGSDQNSVINNSIYTESLTSGAGTGLRLDSGSVSNTAENNTILTNGAGGGSFGISTDGTSNNNNFTGNNVTTLKLNADAVSLAGTGNYYNKNTLSSAVASAIAGAGTTVFNNTLLDNSSSWISIFFGSANFTNTTFLNSNGSIRFYSNFSIVTIGGATRTNLDIFNNRAFINTTNVPFLNTTAQITLRNLTFIDPEPLVDFEDDGTFVECNATICTEDSFTGGVYVYNVTQFTSYSSAENVSTLASCPATINESTILTQNLSSATTCITFGASDIYLDCDGYTITYDTGGTGGDGIVATGRHDITVRNCNIVDTNAGGATGIAIFMTNVQNGSYYNNTIQTNGTTNNYGMELLNNITNNIIANSTIITLGTGASNYGIYLFDSTVNQPNHNNTIINNTIFTNGTSNNYGIMLEDNNSNTTIFGNSITTNGTSLNIGILLDSQAANHFQTGNVIANNTIMTNGSSNTNYGINTIVRIFDLLIENNTIETAVRSPVAGNNHFGIFLQNGAGNIMIRYNFIGTRGTSDGIEIGSAGDFVENITIINNTINTGGASGDGIEATAGWRFIHIENNTIMTGNQSRRISTTHGGSGIIASSNINGNITIINNSITTNGSGTANNRGIVFGNFQNATAANNTISTFGTSDNYGIQLPGGLINGTIENNTIFASGTAGTNQGIRTQGGNFNQDISIRFNNISTNGTSSNTGIFLSTSRNVHAASNTIRTNGTSTTNIGIAFDSNVENSTIANNTIDTDGTGSSHGIATNPGALTFGNVIENNTIRARASGTASIGLQIVNTNSVNNTARFNNISVNGTNTLVGIQLTGSTINNRNFVENNTVFVNATGTQARGIYVATSAATASSSIANNNVTIFSTSTDVRALAVEAVTQVNNTYQNNTFIVERGTGALFYVVSSSGQNFSNTIVNATNGTNLIWIDAAAGNNNNFTNTTFANSNGSIQFTEFIEYNATATDFTQTHMNITFNKTFVNSTTHPAFNRSAVNSLLGLGLTDLDLITPVADFNDDGTFEPCNATTCTLISTTAQETLFNVTRFTSYALAANLPPTHDTPELNSTKPTTNDSNQNLTVYPINVSDPNGDAVKNITDWQLYNGSEFISIAVLNTPFEGGSENGNSTGVPNGTRDYSTYQSNATIFGATFNSTGGQDGFGAYQFDGIDDYINVTPENNFDVYENLSVSLWARIAAEVDFGFLAAKALGTGSNSGWFLQARGFLTQDKWQLDVYDGTWKQIDSNQGFTDGNWHNIAFTYNSSIVKLYIDGQEVNSTSVSGPITANDISLLLGGVPTGFNFNGTIDEVKIFNRTLSGEQINALFLNRTDLIVSNETNVSDIWQACLTPNDAAQDGTTKCSNNITITLPGTPTHDTPILNSTLGTNTTNEDLTVYPQNVSDPNNDAVKNISDWQLYNGSEFVSIAIANLPFEAESTSSETTDFSTYSPIVTVSGPTFSSTAGFDGFGAYIFDGIDDSITVESNQTIGTVTFWAKNATGSWNFYAELANGTQYVDGVVQSFNNTFYNTTDNITTIGKIGSTPAPDTISDLQLWLKADAITNETNGSQIAYWPDSSGTDNNATQTDANRQPLFITNSINGLPSVRFDGNVASGQGDRMDFTTGLTTIRNVFWVLFENETILGSFKFIMGDTTTFHFHRDGALPVRDLWSPSFASSNILNGVTKINGSVVDGTSTPPPTSFAIVSVNTTGNVGANRITGDRTQVGREWQGDYAEIIVYNRSLSQAERETVEFYLGDKYDLFSNVSGTSAEYFNGTIDEFRMFDRNLSSDQIMAMYVNTSNRFDVIDSSETNVGDIWQACVTPSDGTELGATKCSNNLTIQAAGAGIDIVVLDGTYNATITPQQTTICNFYTDNLTAATGCVVVDDSVNGTAFILYNNGSSAFGLNVTADSCPFDSGCIQQMKVNGTSGLPNNASCNPALNYINIPVATPVNLHKNVPTGEQVYVYINYTFSISGTTPGNKAAAYNFTAVSESPYFDPAC